MSIPAFTSRTALVTGASRGIGRAIAVALAEAGAHVAVNYRQRKDDAEGVVGGQCLHDGADDSGKRGG